MGKGDRKSKKGKRAKGSFGVSRSRRKGGRSVAAAAAKPKKAGKKKAAKKKSAKKASPKKKASKKKASKKRRR